MKFWIYRSLGLGSRTETDKYHFISEDEKTPILAEVSLGELLQEVRKVAVEYCKQKDKPFVLSFELPEGNIVLQRNSTPFIRLALSAEEQLNVWEVLKDIPYHS